MNMRFRRYLKLDSPMLRGDDVLALQIRLGLPEAERDGIFGPITGRAVLEFQRKSQLEADGIVGPNTWAALYGAGTVPPEAGHALSSPMAFLQTLLPELREYHGRYGGGIKWRLTARGVEIEGAGIETTSGRPETVRRVCSDYREAIEKTARQTGVPVELIVATMCTESYNNSIRSVDPRAERQEPGYCSDQATPHRVSYGLMQTLLSTARNALRQLQTGATGLTASIDREWLFDPANSILAGAAYIAAQALQTRLDPPVAACAYNAGGVIYNCGANNRWRMRQYPIGTGEHADRFIKWFNDCFRFFEGQDCPFDPATTFWHRFRQQPPEIVREPAPAFVFPLRQKPAEDYRSGGREFGAERSGGTRKHAGCDLKAIPGTPVLAMADGEVIRGPVYFSDGTYALEVRHSNGMVVRYGEIAERVPRGITVGAGVSRGQVIGFVGRLGSGNSMLHLEMYSGGQHGPLTQTGTPFKRRSDLIDPTEYLDSAPLSGPSREPEDAGSIPLEEQKRGAEPRESRKWEDALKDAPTTGASDITASQDGLAGGVEASRQMAETDWERVKKLAGRFRAAASRFGIPAAVLAALASRESRCGAVLDEQGWGDGGHAFGILQIDRRFHELEGMDDCSGQPHIEQAAGIFCRNLERIAQKHPDWEPPFILKGAAVAYNAGIDTVRTKEKMDIGTTGDDYGSDVIARAQYYFSKEDADELNA